MNRRKFATLLGLGAATIVVPQFGRFYRQGTGRLYRPAPMIQLYDPEGRPVGPQVPYDPSGLTTWPPFRSAATVDHAYIEGRNRQLVEIRWEAGARWVPPMGQVRLQYHAMDLTGYPYG